MQSLRKLDAYIRAEVKDAIEVHLRHEPTKISRSRIKRLRGLSQPQYRLRVGDIRVFYDITETTVASPKLVPHWVKVEELVWKTFRLEAAENAQ